MKRFQCIPIAIVLPIFFFVSAIIHAVLLAWTITDMDVEGIVYTGIMFIISIAMAIILLFSTGNFIIIYPDHIVCQGYMRKNKFSMLYSDCIIGLDFHNQSGMKVWWIYVCSGCLKTYKQGGQINSVKIRPGFIRIMYSNEVYREFVAALPKKQRTALITACRCAGLQDK